MRLLNQKITLGGQMAKWLKAVIFGLSFIGSVTHAQASKRWQVTGSWALDGIQTRETAILSQSTRAELNGKAIITRSYDDELYLVFAPSFRFVSGREQDVFSDRLPRDKIFADEAIATWRPTKNVFLTGGAVNQSHLKNTLLVFNRPFPAILASWNFCDKLGISAQLAIPSSYTLDDQATAHEPLPFLQTYSLHSELALSESTRLGLQLNYFRFDDLPQIVAVNSARLGNSTEIFSSATGRFSQGFEGLAPSFLLTQALGRYEFVWSVQAIRNWQTAWNLGYGYSSRLGGSTQIDEHHRLNIILTYYKILPDGSPALYTDPIFSNNRVGSGAEIQLDHQKWQIRFKLSLYRDAPYYRNESMGRRDMLFFGIESLKGEELLAL
jgi:hypothetical protein